MAEDPANQLDEFWISACTVCDWEHHTFVSHRAARWADAHTEDTGHSTTVREWDYD